MHRDLFDAGAIETWLRSFGIWAPAGFVLLYAAGTVLFFSGALLSLAGGALFGPVWGTVWNLLGATLGATLAFLIARGLGADWVARRLGGQFQRLVDGAAAEGWRFVALMRLVPLVPFNLLNYALGLTRISLSTYVLASAICMLPGAIAYTWLGYAGRIGRRRRQLGFALRPSRTWSARHDRVPARGCFAGSARANRHGSIAANCSAALRRATA